MALVGVLQRTDLECVKCLCDCLDVCVGKEAVAGLLSGDTESPEADVEDDYLKLDVCALVHVESRGHLLGRCSRRLWGGGGVWLHFSWHWRGGWRGHFTLELLRRAKSGEGEAGGALEGGDVLEEWEPEIAMPRKKASSQLAGLLLVLTILMRAASFTWAAMYTIDVTALTKRACHMRGRFGSVGIGPW